jgi:histidinol-phosphate/aromatic aminotransferase/cobyric acid decarboxylase-like protein
MNKYWSALARGLEPYVPGEQPRDRRYIKLNTNENPYGPSPKVLDAIREAADDSLRLYPDPTCDILISAAAESYGVLKDQIFAGNGSDEVLAFALPGRTMPPFVVSSLSSILITTLSPKGFIFIKYTSCIFFQFISTQAN